ncbi:DegV family protein [Alkaliphilus oremlandii]|uniref:DegV family protein n=1 Tax=Alkaliphilus oremlandii (strain OhILAs) TaxID=350688 RepID=A8MKF7_ALKOO|nr:DegV family protein [Alkaliphilus oremlandii]ABW20289.1 degV family protein [Alkaliphilus oremlandii OhILAs]
MIKIIADSTCDLSNAVLEQYDISLAPLTINIEGKIYKDRVDIQPDTFYGMMEGLSEHPTTGMPSPMEFLNLMETAIKDGYNEILCICMSSGTSGSYQSAIIAEEYFNEKYPDSTVKIHVVDSKSMSHGSGWLILKSAMMRENGASFEEIVEFNETYKTNVKHFLSVDDLDHLLRSGRLTNASAFIGKILRLKPIMTMRKGKGAIVAKERGQKRVLSYYVEEFIHRNDIDRTDFIIIGYTSDIKVAENLKLKIQNETDFSGEIYIMQMGVSVGTHVGLGAVSMYFIEKGHIKDGLVRNKVRDLIK